jgi:hypothetical protein
VYAQQRLELVAGELISKVEWLEFTPMRSTREVAFDLLRRLLAGERGEVPLHLAMLLEKSSPCDHGDEHYRQVLPPELADVRVSSEVNEQITTALCAEISHNPDQALIFTISFTGADQATKTATHILINLLPAHSQ